MKALISSNESFDLSWVSSWTKNESTQEWEPVYSEIFSCQRVVEVEPDDKTFPIYSSLFWVDCPDDCKADQWYYKDGTVYIKPEDALKPEGE
jgi:hypothetical protein